MPLLWWFTIQTAPTEPAVTWLDLMDRYGLPLVGIVALVIGFRWLYLKAVADRDRAVARAETLEDSIRLDAIPALVKATTAIEGMVKLMERIERRLDDGP